MTFRMRRSIKVMPGVRVTVSKTGVGASVGVRGARYSAHSTGRRTASVGLPGYGMGYVKTTTAGGRARAVSPSRQADRPASPTDPAKPGLLASRGEKALFKALKSGKDSPGELDAIAARHAGHWLAASTLAALKRLAAGDRSEVTITQLRHVAEYPTPPEHDPFIVKYLAHASSMTIGLAPGVEVNLPLSRELVGLALAEAFQERGELAAAIELVEGLEPTTPAAVSLAELYCEADRHDDVLVLTNGIANVDDLTALLMVYRGIAFHRQGLHTAAREAFREALKSKKREPQIRLLGLRHRAETYVAVGQRAMARKDLERALAEDSSAAWARQRLSELS